MHLLAQAVARHLGLEDEAHPGYSHKENDGGARAHVRIIRTEGYVDGGIEHLQQQGANDKEHRGRAGVDARS